MRKALMSEVAKPVAAAGLKVTVVGAGQVGMAVSFALVTQVRSKLTII
jgi:cation diffusion facilitator CzcD-associated flavoprotein CzcO